MVKKIDRDYSRFKNIVKGKIRKDLRKFISKGEMIGKKGERLVSIPIPYINLPKFRFGKNDSKGIGQGEGQKGDPVDGQPGQGTAGDKPGQHILEVEVTIEELAQIMAEELELPNIKPKGKASITASTHTYTGISRSGPESLRHFKRTFKQALKRQIMSGTYNEDDPIIIPVREDKRFRSWKYKEIPQNNAVIFYIMDVSGSMGNDQKEIVRIEAFWIDTWLRSQYKKIETRYIVHDAAAKEVNQNIFYHIKESGGTKISSSFTLLSEIIKRDYPTELWNIYPFYFSDGDNWGSDDTNKCVNLLNVEILPVSNIFCYGQVKSAYGSGQFKKDIDANFKDNELVVTTEINDKDGIYDSIKTFLGKGR